MQFRRVEPHSAYGLLPHLLASWGYQNDHIFPSSRVAKATTYKQQSVSAGTIREAPASKYRGKCRHPRASESASRAGSPLSRLETVPRRQATSRLPKSGTRQTASIRLPPVPRSRLSVPGASQRGSSRPWTFLSVCRQLFLVSLSPFCRITSLCA